MDRLKYVDGLRGIFALIVALYHLNGELFFPGGYLAVDFFFILSGFVLSYVYLTRMEGLSFWNFAGQRFSRLWPLHFVTLLLFLVTFSFTRIMMGDDLSDPLTWGNNTPSSFLKNIFLIHDIGFNIPTSWNFPSWSISIEFWVNLVLFFAFFGLVSKKYLKITLWVIGFMVAIYFAADIANVLSSGTLGHPSIQYERGIFYSHLIRGFMEIFLGVLVFFGARSLSLRTKNMSETNVLIQSMIEICLFFGLVSIVVTSGGDSDLLGVLFFGLLLLLLSGSHETIAKKFLSMRACVFLGTISYAVYLSHMPVFELFRFWDHMFGTIINPIFHAILYLVLAISTMLCVSVFLHFYVEKPAQVWLRKRFSKKATFKAVS